MRVILFIQVFPHILHRSVKAAGDASVMRRRILMSIAIVHYVLQQPSSSRNVETMALHTTPVLPNEVLTCLLRIRRIREQHTFIPRGLLIFTHTAWLRAVSLCDREQGLLDAYLDFCSGFALRLEVPCEIVGRRCRCCSM